jgi:lipopolysaccharide export system protein LptA
VSPARLTAGLLALLLGAGLFPGGPLRALQSDAEHPLEVEADQAEFRDREQTAVYRGGVVAVRGTQRLTGDELTVHLRDGTVTRLIAVGGPATFRMRHDDGEWLDAAARRMEYRAAAQTLVLTGEARVVKGDKTIEAERIVYHLDTDSAEAEAPEGGRVRTILAPAERAEPPGR